MANVQYAVLLLILIMAVLACNGTPERTRCTSQSPCFDLLIFERMAQRVSNYVAGAESENILLKSKTFDKIRQKKYLHSCVLQKILDFYENVLLSDQYIQNYDLDLISTLDIVRNCTYKVKRCGLLYQMANKRPDLEIAEEEMSAQEVAIFQLQKLNYASEKIIHPHCLSPPTTNTVK
ncbi:uncharacterized protein Hap1MRO34_014986 isoform 2-T2 [Clarias gariepinus]|uniref:uncharacterized protein si:ch211-266a5.12 isoform X2 n=1 Tax=Clarias gariepinus TaxID=13013 RepID=UPI00234D9521|nr:uncharacterized protein si:ch211-266a5.12 isoform X2 [Clarias gariepinus]